PPRRAHPHSGGRKTGEPVTGSDPATPLDTTLLTAGRPVSPERLAVFAFLDSFEPCRSRVAKERRPADNTAGNVSRKRPGLIARRFGIGCGQEQLELDVAESSVVAVRRQPAAPPLPDPPAAVRHALENPIEFPALRRALIPDDHVVVVVDEELP